MFARASLPLSLAFLLVVVTTSGHSVLGAECPNPGERPATASDAAVKNKRISVGTCFNPNSEDIGASPEEAKRYLMSMKRQALSQCAPPNEENIGRLNSTFAVCAARFFKAYQERYGTIVITSAYRDGPSGANRCAGGAANSNHTRGVAMDVYPANQADFPKLWKFASDNPEFGICFPHQQGGANTTGYSDRPHMILAGIGGSEAAACARQGVKSPCSGTAFNPREVGPVPPSSSLTDSFRKMIGGDQPTAPSQPTPQAQPAPAAQPSLPQQPGAVQSGQLFGNQGAGLGTAGAAPTGTAVPVIATPPGGTKSPSTTPDNAEQASYYSSVTDQLLQLAYDTPLATSTAVATSVPLTIDGSDVKTIDTESGTIDSRTSSGTMAYGAPGTVLPSSNTFVSNDLGGGPYQVVASYRGEPTGFVALLVQLRDALAALLNILRPMGIREAISPAPSVDHEEEFIEHDFDPEADFKAGLEEDITIEFITD